MFLGLGKLLFKNKLLINLIIIFQLGISLFIGNLFIGFYNEKYLTYDFTYNFSENTAFYSPMKINGKIFCEIDEEFLRDENTLVEVLPLSDNNGNVTIFTYGKKTCEVLKSQLREGEWEILEPTDGFIDCAAIGNKYAIGDTFSQRIGNRTFSFKITGKFDEKAVLISSTRSSSVLRASMLFYEYDSKKSKTAVVCYSKDLADAVGTVGNALIYDLTEKSKTSLKNSGSVLSLSEIRENTDNEISYYGNIYLPFAICFALLGLVSLIAISLMNIFKNKKVYDTYFLCGMKKLDYLKLNLGYVFWVNLGIVLITAVLFVLAKITAVIDGSNYCADTNNFLISTVFLLTVSVFTAVSFLLVRKTAKT